MKCTHLCHFVACTATTARLITRTSPSLLMKFKKAVTLVALLLSFGLPGTFAQKLMGLVVQKNEKGVDEPVAGANVYWAETSLSSMTRDNGVFLIDRLPDHNLLVISFVGMQSDTVSITDETNIKVELVPS